MKIFTGSWFASYISSVLAVVLLACSSGEPFTGQISYSFTYLEQKPDPEFQAYYRRAPKGYEVYVTPTAALVVPQGGLEADIFQTSLLAERLPGSDTVRLFKLVGSFGAASEMPAVAPPALHDELVPLNETKEVLGYECAGFVLHQKRVPNPTDTLSRQDTIYIRSLLWVAQELQAQFNHPLLAPPNPINTPGTGGLLLEMEQTLLLPTDSFKTRLIATHLSTDPPLDSLLAIPSDYRIIPPQVLQQLQDRQLVSLQRQMQDEAKRRSGAAAGAQ